MKNYGNMYSTITRNTSSLSRNVFQFRTAEQNYMIEALKKINPKRVLDYGCNDGFFVERLQTELESESLGADINEHALAYARQAHPGYEFLMLDESFFATYKEAFNAVVLMHVLEHIHDRKDSLDKIHSLLAEDGVLVVVVPQERIRGDATVPQIVANAATGNFENPHVVSFTYDSLKEELEASGFSSMDYTYVNYLPTHISSGRRWDAWSLVMLAKKI